jgi:TRAP-type C4-dicarboxylate transport system permease large subunit
VILGSVLEGIPAIVLFGPLLFPIARLVGVNEVHYAMVVIFAMGLGLFSPPFGVGFYAACAIGRVSPDVAIGRVWPHLTALFIALVILIATGSPSASYNGKVHAPLATPRYAALTGEFQQPAKQRAPGAQRKPPADQH